MTIKKRHQLVAVTCALIATSTVPSEAREGFFGASRQQIAGSLMHAAANRGAAPQAASAADQPAA